MPSMRSKVGTQGALEGKPALSVLVCKIIPLGLSSKSIDEDIAKETNDWKDLRTANLTTQNRQRRYQTEVVPSAFVLVIKAPLGSYQETERNRKTLNS